MSTKLFSLYDVSLLVLILQCLIVAGNARVLVKNQTNSANLLVAFFVCFAIFQLNTLLFWLGALAHVYTYLILLAAGFTFGPFLYLVVQSYFEIGHDSGNEKVTNRSSILVKKNLIHFIPLAIYPVYLLLLYLSLGNGKLYAASQNFQVLWYDPLHVALVMSMLATQITYSVLACKLYLQTDGESKNPDKTNEFNLLDIKTFARNPVFFLVLIFSCYWIWNVLAFVLSLIASGEQVINIAGTIGNLMLFILLGRIGFIQCDNLATANEEESEEKELEEGKDPYRDEQVERIAGAMEEKQLYLNPELTLEQLAEHAQIPPRLVSTIINRRFNKNFFEFTNSYRVDHAKNLLKISDKGVSMLDIMADSGFNSKSAFNRFFKKYTEMTPTQYRQAQKKNKIEK